MLRIIIIVIVLFLAYMFLSDAVAQLAGDLRQFFFWMFPKP
jgi:hypothetical protein